MSGSRRLAACVATVCLGLIVISAIVGEWIYAAFNSILFAANAAIVKWGI